MAQCKFESEAALAAVIVKELRNLGWAVYQEVDFGNKIADIIAVWNGKIVWIIETKLHLNLTVLSQAWGWTSYAHYVSVGIPVQAKRARGSEAAHIFLKDHGIGALTVGHGFGGVPVVELLHPVRLNRHARSKRILKELRPEHMDFKQAGSVEGHRFTPFRATTILFFDLVRDNPDAELSEVLKLLKGKHHYSTDSSMKKCLTDLCMRGVFKDKIALHYGEEDRKLRVRLCEK